MISWGECSPLHVDVLLIGRLLASISDLKKKSSTYLSVSYTMFAASYDGHPEIHLSLCSSGGPGCVY